eukprot:CAMPEP_0113564766 /NCGR_PEP_ID=MMETSP0015_2-20120614/21804_1 /TAXON_ID=2838 /ORGANISM="Odontella" /LENGTH=495 /DNA_ID=CAMNT_0000466889 /DNA_START=106 /DNA_END=1593 /DNA_ORIENTATION=- /assembly_acc=CAM_ASM_000160
MGLTFRSGGYMKQVYLGKRTVKDGEAAAVWNDRGQHREVIGPERIWLFNSTVRFLTRIKAEDHQYLRVCHRDGRVEHINGPCSMYQNPALHDEITCHDGINVATSTDCIVVYSDATPCEELCAGKKLDQGERKMRVIQGPILFRPKENETVHEFRWSSTGGGSSLQEGANNFCVLHTDRERSWNVALSIKTADLASFSVKLSFKYHMTSLEKLLQANDPIQKMFTGLQADSQVIGSKVLSKELRSDSVDSVVAKLTTFSDYPAFISAAADAGFCVSSVILVELDHGEELKKQADVDQKLASRLRAEKAGQAQRRELYDLELDDRHKKIEQEAELERQEAETREKFAEQSAAAKLRTEKAERAQKRELYELELEDRKRKVAQEAEFQRLQAETTAKLEAELQTLREAAVERELAIRQKGMEAEALKKDREDKAAIHFLKALKEMDVKMSDFMCTAGGMKIASAPLSRADALSGIAATKQRRDESKADRPIAWERND